MEQDRDRLLPYLAALDGHPVSPGVLGLTGEACSIGRATDCTIRVVRDGVSRRHALVECTNGIFYITDQHSSWGTYVNGQRLTPHEPYRLTSEALIGLGSPRALLRFRDPDSTSQPEELANGLSRVLEHDSARQRFHLHGRVLDLPFLAYRLLVYLHTHQGVICRASSCIHAVWEIDEPSADELTDRLYRLMSELRLALEEHQAALEPHRRVSIESQRRRGYILVVPGVTQTG
jgi:DNA-binding winged helix-turn-helix (wHTH) protein